MNVDAIVCLDAVDGFYFIAASGVQLIVSTAVDDGAFQQRALEGAIIANNNNLIFILLFKSTKSP